MNLADFQYAPELTLPDHATLFRVQRLRSRPGTVRIRDLRVPPRGLLLGRFDLVDGEVAYFAEAPETAIYETLARREAMTLPFETLRQRALLTLSSSRPIRLLDLRPHAHAYPVLQSLRLEVTQGIAGQAWAAGYEGIAFRSAQQFNADCFAIFDAALRAFRMINKKRLVEPGTDALHRAVVAAIRGSQIPLVG
ncbi:MAG TPA: RES family NAD+ phosphorylase [Albitalea sp.]|uniref:RES family NAD+ phosphorylase n=1 Tax=Piscinibacter sp. TaxID=1903157 RepID=UPI002ED693D1